MENGLYMTAGVKLQKFSLNQNWKKKGYGHFDGQQVRSSLQCLDCWLNHSKEVFPGNQQKSPRTAKSVTNISQSKRTNSLP